MADWDRKEYWDEEYSSIGMGVEPFDWYQIGATQVWPILKYALKVAGVTAAEAHLLEAGMGTSPLSQDLCATKGFQHITAVDIAEAAVEAAKRRNNGKFKGLQFKTQDCRKMDGIADKSCDLVLDKATMDAIACAGNKEIQEYFQEVSRVLRKNGVFVVISGTCREVAVIARVDCSLAPLVHRHTFEIGALASMHHAFVFQKE